MSFYGNPFTGSGQGDRAGQRLTAALSDFRNARRQAAIRSVLGRLQGTSLELLSYEDIAHQLQITGQVERGLREIPLDKIVGSVGRYDEFDSSFLPLRDRDAQRWAGVRAAAADPTELPPIEVYQIGDAYFVIDGNHRVSIARRAGVDYLAAQVIEINTRVPLPADLEHDELIVASEYAVFLEHTRLDRLRPDADLTTSLPGQYEKLENHIEVHRYFLEMKGDRGLTDEEAVLSWYDDAYLPVIEVIREYGLLRGFKDRTETDLYLWVAENQAALRNEFGWDVEPLAAVEQPARPLEMERQGRIGRLYRRVIEAVIPQAQRSTTATWSEHKMLDRYSDRLFATVLVIIAPNQTQAAVDQALKVARLDNGYLLMLQLEPDTGHEEDDMLGSREQFAAMLSAAEVSGEIGFAQGDPGEMIRRRANFADLLVMDVTRLTTGQMGTDEINTLLEGGTGPVLLVPGAARSIKRVLLLYDDRPQAWEALFVAAYMAEMWGCAVVLLAEPGASAQALATAAPYLEMHESPPESIIAAPFSARTVFEMAAEQDCDLIVIGGYKNQPLSKSAVATWLLDAAQDLRRPLLICP